MQNNWESVSLIVDGITIDTQHRDFIFMWNELTTDSNNLYKNYCAQKYYKTWHNFVLWKRYLKTMASDPMFLNLLPYEIWEKIFKYVAFGVDLSSTNEYVLNPSN